MEKTGKNFTLKWKRTDTFEYPKVWHTFKAKDIDSDNLVEYRIQDLPESRFQEGIDFMAENFCKYEPLNEALGEFKPFAIISFY